MLIIDEFGKLLEYAAVHPETEDLLLMQTLAESAARSDAKILIVTILHTNFGAYLTGADEARRAEWRKVQGRYTDVAFLEPPEQLLHLVKTALHTHFPADFTKIYCDDLERPLAKTILKEVSERLDLALLHECAPLHPVTSLLLWPLFRSKLAQNERSLFSFLTSEEPEGFQSFLRMADWKTQPPYYRPVKLYDYVLSSLGAAAIRGTGGYKWAEVEAALERVRADAPPLTQDVVKTMGLLWMYGASVGLRADEATLMYACGDIEGVSNALTYLEDNAIIVYRQFDGTYAFWEGSDVDLAALYYKASERSGAPTAERLTRLTKPTPFVARAHYLETGTLRYFPIRILDADVDLTQPELVEGDGEIIYVLCRDEAERKQAVERATNLTHQRLDLIIAVPGVMDGLPDALNKVEAWRSVRDTTPELKGDRAARKELGVNLRYADERLKAVAGGVLGLKGYPFTPEVSTWVHKGQIHEIQGGRAFQTWLSGLCNELYCCSPPIQNELLNRSGLSSSAKAALNRLIKLMVFGPSEHRFGVSGTPPEVSMYEAVLSTGGFYNEESGYSFRPPSSKAWQPVWHEIQEFFKESEVGRKDLTELYARLQASPFGVRSGPLPVLIFAALLENPGEIAVYRDGLYQPNWTEELVELITHVPEKIALQRFKLDNQSRSALRAVREVLDGFKLGGSGASLLEVAEPLIVSVYRLPQFSRKTRKLPPEVLALRDALLNARDPNTLLLNDLPDLLSADLSDAKTLAEALKHALNTLFSVYPQLLDSVEQQTRTVFGLGPDAEAELKSRAEPLLPYAAESKLNLFVKTLSRLGEGDYREALARAVLTGKPADIWSDADLITFGATIMRLKSDFVKLEELVAEYEESGAERVFRVGILGDGLKEVSANVSLSSEQQLEAEELAVQLEALLTSTSKQARVKLAALSQTVLKLAQEV